jgi:SAM-dependent methyltransferase
MAVFSIHSKNPKFSFLLKKNPASGLQAKPLRSGTLFGWYSKTAQENDTFCFFFRDQDHEYSYPRVSPTGVPLVRQESYTNIDQYGAPPVLANGIREFAQHLLNKIDPDDTAYPVVVEVPCLRVNQRYIEFFKYHFPSVQVEHREIAHGHHSLRFSGTTSLQYLLHYLSWFSIMNAIRLQYGAPGEGEAVKYLRSLHILDAPYFMRYLFKCNFLRGRDLFEKLVPELSKSQTRTYRFVQGWNASIRYRWVKKLLNPSVEVLDVGCGEGAFFGLQRDVLQEGKRYRAVDKDQEARESAAKKAASKQLPIEVLSEIPADIQDHQVLLMEVIEHMELEEAKTLLRNLQKQQVSRLFISTPNRAFNIHYFDEDQESRHADHKFELNRAELEVFLRDVFPEGLYRIEPVGDEVDGEPSNFGIVWERT